jgi:D-xylose transport system substrate-binding protein
MKTGTFITTVTVIVIGISFFGCGGPKKAAMVPKVGVSLPTQREERWVRDKTKMDEVCKEIGLELELRTAENDAAQQEKQCDSLIALGIKVLIVAPHDCKAAAAIVSKAHAAGIKVIAYDRMILDSDVDLYVSFDNEKVGELQGEYITRLTPRGAYILLAGSPDDNNATLFRKGAMKYIQPLIDKKDITIVADQWIKDWNPGEAEKVMSAALVASKNKVAAVLAPNDGIAGACIAALSAQGLGAKVTVTGQDAELSAVKRIIKGTQSMTVYKNTRKLGAVAVQAALALSLSQPVAMINGKVNNGKIDVPAILCEPVAVDKANLDSVLIESGYLLKEDVYRP